MINFLVVSLLAVYIIGCGIDDDRDDPYPVIPEDDMYETPPSGSEIATDTIIYLAFSYAPENLTVSAGVATGTGKSVKISGPFIPGLLRLTITWKTWKHETRMLYYHETRTLYYTVATPDTDAPKLTHGTVTDGDRDVDYNAINAEAKIEFWFSEPVRGHVALQTEDSEDLGWLGKVEGNQAILKLVKGKELNCGATYIIVGKVSDEIGNTTDINTTFATQRCP